LTTNQNLNHLGLVVVNSGSHEAEIRQRIIEATSGLNNHYFTMMAERMSVNNADVLAQFIISNRQERNVASNTIMMYIDGIVYLENYHKHKDLNKMDRNDITSFLDSYRKPETVDPLHKWINTYNTRLRIICKFFKWLYSSKFDGLAAAAPIITGIKRLNRKEKSSYQAKDLWTHEDDAIFLKYCEDKRLKCYHAMARDTSWQTP
jgi:hypothetical protein